MSPVTLALRLHSPSASRRVQSHSFPRTARTALGHDVPNSEINVFVGRHPRTTSYPRLPHHKLLWGHPGIPHLWRFHVELGRRHRFHQRRGQGVVLPAPDDDLRHVPVTRRFPSPRGLDRLLRLSSVSGRNVLCGSGGRLRAEPVGCRTCAELIAFALLSVLERK